MAYHVEAGLVGEARADVLDRAGEDVAVVRAARGERWAVVERVLRLALGLAQLVLEGVDFLPELHGLLLALGEGDARRGCAAGAESLARRSGGTASEAGGGGFRSPGGTMGERAAALTAVRAERWRLAAHRPGAHR